MFKIFKTDSSQFHGFIASYGVNVSEAPIPYPFSVRIQRVFKCTDLKITKYRRILQISLGLIWFRKPF